MISVFERASLLLVKERAAQNDGVSGPQPQRGGARQDRRPRPPRREWPRCNRSSRRPRSRSSAPRAPEASAARCCRTSSPAGSRAWPRPSDGTVVRSIRAVRRLAELEEPPELVVIAVAADRCPRSPPRRRHGAKALLILTSGLADGGTPVACSRSACSRSSATPACAWSGRTASACSTATLRCASTPRLPARRCSPAAWRSARSRHRRHRVARARGGTAARVSSFASWATAPTCRRTTCWSCGRRIRARPR